MVWCDTFDADLLKVVPGAAEALGDMAGIQMETYSTLTGGKINCPASWNGPGALFWTSPQFRPAACYWTRTPVVPCTFLEAVRDEWVHTSAINVNGYAVWEPPAHLMMGLMYDLRGWTPLPDARREEVQVHVRRSLEATAERLRRVLEGAMEVDLSDLIAPGELPAPPHEVTIRPVLEVTCETCGALVLDVTTNRAAAQVSQGHAHRGHAGG